jgi:hypothetical protein
MDTIINNSWYDENGASEATGIPMDIVHTFYEAMLADERVPKAYYKGAGIVMLSGFTINALNGRAQQPSKRHRR